MRLRLVGAGLAGAALTVLAIGPPISRTAFEHALFDAGHAPLFGLVALGVLAMLGPGRGGTIASRRRTYAIAFVLTCVIGLLSELAQVLGTRNADLWDLVRNVLGAAAFLSFAATIEPGVVAWPRAPHVPVAAVTRVLAGFLLALAFVPLAVTGMSYVFRNAAFPHIMDFESYWESRFIETRSARVTLGYLPEPWTDPNRLVGVVTFEAGKWPTFVIEEPAPDWTGYDALTFRVWSPNASPVPLTVRVDDYKASRSRRHDDRFQVGVEILPGEHRVSIPLSDIRQGPVDRELDLGRVKRVVVFARRPPETVTLYFDDIRLE